jgi:virginiamycin B lyase
MKRLIAASLLAASLSTPALAQRITEFPIASTGGWPFGITVERLNSLLVYTEYFGNKIGFMNTDGSLADVQFGGTVHEISLPNPGSHPSYICEGPDFSLWYTLPGVNHVGRIIMGDGSSVIYMTPEYTIPTADSQPTYIGALSDRRALASELSGGKLVSITWDGTVSELSPKTTDGGTNYVDATNPGLPLYTEPGASKIVIYDPFGGYMTEHAVTLGSNPTSVVKGPDGNYWVLEDGTNSVRRGFVGEGGVTFPIPTASSGPVRLINGPDGNLWFLETNFKNKLARVTPSGVITEYHLPGIPGDMVLGPDGNFWITEPAVDKILRFRPFVSGDVNGDGTVDVSDVFYVINFLFASGPAPQ